MARKMKQATVNRIRKSAYRAAWNEDIAAAEAEMAQLGAQSSAGKSKRAEIAQMKLNRDKGLAHPRVTAALKDIGVPRKRKAAA